MKTVWRYRLPVSGRVDLELPLQSLILSVQSYDSDIGLWALVQGDPSVELRAFEIVPTGREVLGKVKQFHGTVQVAVGSQHQAVHVFEVIP